MSNAAARKQQALAKLAVARTLLDTVQALMAEAELILVEDGAYQREGAGDVCGAVRDEIGELEGDVNDYVN